MGLFGGIGKLFSGGIGGLVGGALEGMGLGKIAPFVKLGLNALTGNWAGVAQDVFGLVSKFAGGDFLGKADKNPPLGGFDDKPAQAFNGNNNQQNSKLDSNRLGGLFKGLAKLFRGFQQMQGGNMFGGLGKIFKAFKAIEGLFDDNQLLNNRLGQRDLAA